VVTHVSAQEREKVEVGTTAVHVCMMYTQVECIRCVLSQGKRLALGDESLDHAVVAKRVQVLLAGTG